LREAALSLEVLSGSDVTVLMLLLGPAPFIPERYAPERAVALFLSEGRSLDESEAPFSFRTSAIGRV